MSLEFVETRDFSELVEEYLGGDAGLIRLQRALLTRPDAGVVITGTNGLRKLRWPDPRRGKGKRGGLRVIYLYVPRAETILLLDVYDKDELDDLSPDVKRLLAVEANRFRDRVTDRRR